MAALSHASDAVWREAWLESTRDIPHDASYKESAEHLRRLIKSKLLLYTDAHFNPDRFFEAHRLLVGLESPGFSIRATVQFNLFAGTILGLGSPEQVKFLETLQEEGVLGCFALTEKLAGVNSGLVVQTIATYDPEQKGFVIHCPTEGSYKNWISQGLTAEKAAVIADLRVNGKSYGPHAFLVDMRDFDTKQLKQGITVGDMGGKSTGNDLDNAWIKFDNVFVPESCLLSRFSEIRDGKYHQKTHERMRIEIIGQRLLTGRIAIAQASLEFCEKLYNRTREYTSKKLCWTPYGETPLGNVAHIKAQFDEAEWKLRVLKGYCFKIERALSACLSAGEIPSPELVDAVAVAKIVAVENAIALSFGLKQEVGSYALMAGSGFEHLDFLTCCKFAEGDSRILMQKLARDRVRQLSRLKGMDLVPASQKREAELCMKLVAAGKEGWDANFRTVYALSDAVQNRTVYEWTGKSLCEGRSHL